MDDNFYPDYIYIINYDDYQLIIYIYITLLMIQKKDMDTILM